MQLVNALTEPDHTKPAVRLPSIGGRSLLVVTNGHGEDVVAANVLDELSARCPTGLQITAWPLIGRGAEFRRRGFQVIGEPNMLPSEGFGGIDYRLLLRDLLGGFIRNHWRQFRLARTLRGKFDLMLAVGDIVPLLAAEVVGAPAAFIGCAKSAYSGPQGSYSNSERWLLRRNCLVVYPRDALTARELGARGLPVRYLGNPMMDGLSRTGAPLDLPDKGATVVAMLPGSREDAEENAVDLLKAASELVSRAGSARRYAFVVPVHPGHDFAKLQSLMSELRGGAVMVEAAPATLKVDLHGGAHRAHALIVKHAFADALQSAAVAIGMAGTANEQAVGLGVPLVVVPGKSVQGDKYVRMKMKYFGAAALRAACQPSAVAAAVERILNDTALRDEMVRAGRARMGEPGASTRIAADLLELLGAGARTQGEASDRVSVAVLGSPGLNPPNLSCSFEDRA